MISQEIIKKQLKIIAKERKIHFNTCWKQLLLERFLFRLARSPHSHKFIFKGGFLLSYLMEIGRETTDLDFLLTRMNAEEKELQKAFEDIISIDSIDGFYFSFESIKLLNQPHMDYSGYRITLKTEMKDKVQIDIGIGDIVEPLIHEIPLIQHLDKPFFESSISLLVYPPEAIFSEKLETILSKGPHNTRMKDYHDLILLLRNRKILNVDKLKMVITNTFSHRDTIIRPIAFSETSLKGIQKLWSAHLRDLGDNARTLDLPKDISIVMEEINQYVLSVQKISSNSLIV